MSSDVQESGAGAGQASASRGRTSHRAGQLARRLTPLTPARRRLRPPSVPAGTSQGSGADPWPRRWRTSSPATGSPSLMTMLSAGPPSAGNAAWTPSPPPCGPPRSCSATMNWPDGTGLACRDSAARPQHDRRHLTSVRDLARFLTASRDITGWATVNTGDIESFLAAQPSTAAHRLAGLRRFFRFAGRQRLVLTDPAKKHHHRPVLGIPRSQPHCQPAARTVPALDRRPGRRPPARGADRKPQPVAVRDRHEPARCPDRPPQ